MPATLSVIWYTGLLVCHFAWYAIDNTCIAGTCLLLASLDQRDPIVCLAWLWGPVVVLLVVYYRDADVYNLKSLMRTKNLFVVFQFFIFFIFWFEGVTCCGNFALSGKNLAVTNYNMK